MKKLIYEVMVLALVISYTSNSFATYIPPKNSLNTDDKLVRQFTDAEYDRLMNKDGVINGDQLDALMKRRAKGDNSPLYVTLRKSEVAKGVEKSLKGAAPLEVVTSSPTSLHYGQITDPETGITYILNKTPQKELKKYEPMNLRFHTKALGNAAAMAAGPGGMTFVHEASTFYIGVGANHVLNLMKSYEKNPMALEMFVEELKDPVAQMGFYAFMVGNRYANTVFQKILEGSGQKLSQASRMRVTRLLGFLAMGVGSIFSNISHDLLTLTKPCATALVSRGKPEYDTAEKVWAKCQEGWDAVMTSDNLARYVTSVMTVVVASIASAVAQSMLVGAVTKTMPLDGIKVVLKKITSKKGLAKAAKLGKTPMPGPVGLMIGTVNLVIFLQADEMFHPHIHHLVESVGNSSPKLSSAKKSANLYLKSLEQNQWNDTDICKQSIDHASQNRKDHEPAWIQNERRACVDGMDGLARLHEKNSKWRDTLSYEFMNSYGNWARFISEFQVMHDVSYEYYQQLITFVNAKRVDQGKETSFYNPLSMDNPFFGVTNSENLPISDELDFPSMNMSKALRVVESIPLIDKSIAALKAANAIDDYLKPLTEIKALIEVYKKDQTPANYASLAKALEYLNGVTKSAERLETIARNTRDRSSLPTEFMLRKRLAQKVSSIKAIRNFIGDPRPLKMGSESFFEVFNEYVKVNKSEYVKLFDEKGNAAKTLTWYAVCGNELNSNSRVDVRRSTVATSIDKGINAITGGINSLANWAIGNKNVLPNEREILLREDLSPALSAVSAIKFGTGVDFYAPKIVKDDMTQYCGSQPGDKMFGISGGIYDVLPSKSKANAFEINVNGKKYSSLFDYLTNNMRADVVNLKGEPGREQSDFHEWWAAAVTPKVEKAYDKFMDDYSVLLNEKYRESVDGGKDLARGQSDMAGFEKIIRASKNKPWNNASNVSQSYAEELNSYIKILDRIYAVSPELNKAGALQKDKNIKFFQLKLANLRVSIYGLLNDFRNFNTDGSYAPKTINGPNNVPVIVESYETTDFHQKYAKVLVDLAQVYAALGFTDQMVTKAAGETPFYKAKKDLEKAAPTERLFARIQSDEAIGLPFGELVAKLDPSRDPMILNYGLEPGKNVLLDLENTGQTQETEMGTIEIANVKSAKLVNFKSNDRLAVSALVANNLFIMAEAIYQNISTLNLAKMGNDYTKTQDPSDKNRPTSTFNR